MTPTTPTTIHHRVWYDTEFYENGSTIDLISIGLVAEDGREYYAQSTDYDYQTAHASDWLRKNVFAHLTLCPSGASEDAHRTVFHGRCENAACPWRNTEQLARDVSTFLAQGLTPDDTVELWGDYCAYDHVALAQLYGPMIGLPSHIPMFTRDLEQWRAALGHPALPEQTLALDGYEHHALGDARWTRRAWEFLSDYELKARTREFEGVATQTIQRVGELLVNAPPTVWVGVTDPTRHNGNPS